MQDSKRAALWLQCLSRASGECIFCEYTLRIRGERGLNLHVTKDLHVLTYYWKRGISNPWFDVLQIRLMVSQKLGERND